MIPSVNISKPFSASLSRSTPQPARQGSAVAAAEGAVLRAIDKIDDAAGRSGLELSRRQEDRAAVDSQRPNSQGMVTDEAAEAASLIEAKTAVRANVAVIKTSDRMVGTLLDLFA